MLMPRIMGVLNVTPDSFSDGGKIQSPQAALMHAMRMIEAGADIIDIGGESSRPGAIVIGLQEELDRVMPVLERIRQETAHPISIDTTKPEVMRAALDAGASMINDIHALEAEGALEIIAASLCDVVLMHHDFVDSEEITDDLLGFFRDRIAACEQAGILHQRLYLDPGFGFGKTLAQQLTLLSKLEALSVLGLPVLIGVSRKSMLGQVTGKAVHERVSAGLAVAVYAALQGVAMIRTHDVSETRDALIMIQSIQTQVRVTQ